MKRYVRSTTYNGFDESEFNRLQMSEIREGLESGLDISIYADPEFAWQQMHQIRKGLKSKVDVSIYADLKFDKDQMSEIREGLESGVDVSWYADPKFDWRQMHQIRHGLESGLDISIYSDPSIPFAEMVDIYNTLKSESKTKTSKKTTWKSIINQLEADLGNGIDPLYEQTSAADYLYEIMYQVASKQGVWLEPSIQGGVGGIWIYNNDDDSVLAEDIDYQEFNETVLDLAFNSSSAEAFEKAYNNYLSSLY